MRHIITIAAFGFDVRENTNERGASFVRAFRDEGYKVTHISTDFDHAQKAYISMPLVETVDGVDVVRLHVDKYVKNLSIERICSHLQFAYKLKQYLNSLSEKPDYIYCVTPTSTSAYVAGKYCKKHHIPFIVDLIDVWPDSLLPIIKSRLINIVLFPWYYISHKAYRMADYICGESIKYATHAHTFNPSAPWSFVYLGVNRSKIKRLIDSSNVEVPEKKATIRICYGGDLGNSYGFDGILNALCYIQEKGIEYEMYFVGGGEKHEYIQNYVKVHKLNVFITGKLPYCDYLKYLSTCDIAFNAFARNTKVVHSYKFNDYMATNNIVLSNLKGETADMIDKYHIGMNYTEEKSGEVLYEICSKWEQYSSYKDNISHFVDEVLDSDKIYPKVIRDIENLSYEKK